MKRKASQLDEENVEPAVVPKPLKMKTSERRSCEGHAANLKIVSWNVNGLRAWLNGGGLKYLEEEKADIVTFQELKCDREKIPVGATPKGYKSYWLSGDQGSGATG